MTINIEILQFLHYHPLSNRAEIMAGLTRSAQKSPNVWVLCAHRTGNECPSLGLSMPNAWSLSAQRLVPECPFDGQDSKTGIVDTSFLVFLIDSKPYLMRLLAIL